MSKENVMFIVSNFIFSIAVINHLRIKLLHEGISNLYIHEILPTTNQKKKIKRI